MTALPKQATLDNTKMSFERATELRKSGDIAPQTLDDARRTYDVAQAMLAMARSSRSTTLQEVLVQTAAVNAATAAAARANMISIEQ